MWDLLLYLGITSVGYGIGYIARRKEISLGWSGKVQTIAISALVFTMGLRIGCNDEVVGKLDSIGVYAAIFTVVVMVFSVLAIKLTRKLLGINKFGLREEPDERGCDRYKKISNGACTAGMHRVDAVGTVDTDNTVDTVDACAVGDAVKDKVKSKIDFMTVLIVVFVALGIAAGYIFFRKSIENADSFNELLATAIKVGLCTLLVFVGIDIGIEGKVVKQFKSVGIRILAIPIAVVIGTFAGSVACSFLLPISLKESLAIGAGLGWYSLAPGIIMDKGFVVAGAISFMHNVMREMFALMLIPVVAQHIGYVETVGLPGAPSMDVCLPIVERSTSSTTAVYSFVNGAVLSIAVPVLVTLVIG